MIHIDFTSATDDRTPRDRIGYRITQEAIDFTLTLTAVDRAGNESAPLFAHSCPSPGQKPDR